MKKFVFSLLLGAFVAGCTVTSSSDEGRDKQQKEENPQQPPPPPPPVSHSPFKFDVKQMTSSTILEFPYVEAQDLADGRVELRFFTRPPMTMCSVDSFYNSSSYETQFNYFRVSVAKATGKTQIRSGIDAEYGKRGGDWGSGSRYVTGSVTMEAVQADEYSGWVDAELADKSKVQGNFRVVNCYSSINFLKKMKVDDLNSIGVRMRGTNGAIYEVNVRSSYRDEYRHTYQEYSVMYANYTLKIEARIGTPREMEDEVYGGVAGLYIGAGNMSCSRESTGPAVAKIEGNKMIFNQGVNHQPFFCKYNDGRPNSGELSYDPVTGKYKLSLYNKLGHFEGEF